MQAVHIRTLISKTGLTGTSKTPCFNDVRLNQSQYEAHSSKPTVYQRVNRAMPSEVLFQTSPPYAANKGAADIVILYSEDVLDQHADF